MNDNLKGGIGECQYCHQFCNNVSYHEAHECPDRPIPENDWLRGASEIEDQSIPSAGDSKPSEPFPGLKGPYKDEKSLHSAGLFYNNRGFDCRIIRTKSDKLFLKVTPAIKPSPNGLSIKCNVCGNVITEPAAVLFSPPLEHNINRLNLTGTLLVKKYHVCQNCFLQLQHVFSIE